MSRERTLEVELQGRTPPPFCRRCIGRPLCSPTAFLSCSTWHWQAKEFEQKHNWRFKYNNQILHRNL